MYSFYFLNCVFNSLVKQVEEEYFLIDGRSCDEISRQHITIFFESVSELKHDSTIELISFG